MDSSSKSSYQDFEPRFEWIHHPDSHVLILHLIGFRSNQLKVQVTSTGKLRLSGERRLGSGKLLRFTKEFDVPADADTDKVSAKLEEGILYVKQPRKPSAAAVSSTTPTEQPTSKPPPTAAKPKADPQPPTKPPKPAVAKPSVDPPSVRQNVPKSQNEKAQSEAGGKQIPTPPKPQEPSKLKEAVEDPLKLPTDAPTVRQNAPQSRNEKSQAQASGKQIPTPPKPQEPSKPKEAVEDSPKLPTDPPTVRQNAPQNQNEKSQAQAIGKQIPPPQKPQERIEKQTEEKDRVHTKLKDALKKIRDEEEGKQGNGSKMEEEKGKGKEDEGSHGRELEKEGEVAEERRGRRRRRKRSEEEMVEEESGRWRRRGEGYKQVVDGMVKELRTNMVTLVLGIAVVVIVYLNVTKNAHVEEEL